MLDKILSLFFPPKCPYCQKPIGLTLTECDKCRSEFPTFAKSEIIPSGEMCISPFVYDSLVRQAIINYKFYGRKQSADSFSKILADTVKSEYADIHFDTVTAVPLSGKRLRERGYNQSEIVAKQVAEILKIPYERLTDKVKENREQHDLSLEERKENIQGVYALCGNASVSGKTILLIDDVITTGYTLSECCRVLKSGGASKIYCAAIAAKV